MRPLKIGLAALGLLAGLLLADSLSAGLRLRAPVHAEKTPGSLPDADHSERQVTVFAIQATPGLKSIDPRLASVKTQLRKVLPDHGFKLLTVESKRIGTSESISLDLGNGYKTETTLVESVDENGKVRIRCVLTLNGKHDFTTLVKTPANQLFFYERLLKDGTKVVIGVGAR